MRRDGVWSEQVALVTGGAGDLGCAIAEALYERGARVAVADLEPAAGSSSDRRSSHVLDISDRSAVDAWVGDVVDVWGAPTIVVLAAGSARQGRLIETSSEDWRVVIDGCLTGAFVTATAAIRAMLAAGTRGRIVAIGSWAADAPHPHIGAYSAAKAGLRGLVRTLALDHAHDGILVNEVAPGIVSAGLSGDLLEADPHLRDRTLGSIPVGHVVAPSDVVRDVLFLASPRNRNTTGSTIVTDGGLGLASPMNPGGSAAHDEGSSTGQ